MLSRRRIHLIWIGVFATWSLLLSGILEGLIGAPGVLQALRLEALLVYKQEQLKEVESRAAELKVIKTALQTDVNMQERTIRKTLGYAAQDELVIHFDSTH